MVKTSDKIKILFVIRYFHPYIGGMEKQALNLAAALHHGDVSVEVVTSRFYKAWSKREIIKGVPVNRLTSPRIKIVGAFIFLICLGLYLLKNRSHFNIIHTFQVGYTSAMAILLGRILSKPTVLKLASSGIGGDVNRHRRTPWGRIFLFLGRLSLRTITLNNQMRAELIRANYNKNNLVHIPNGVDIKAFHRTNEPESLKKRKGVENEKIILYIGRLSPEKGLDFLIRAYAKLDPALKAKLYIVGEGPELARVQGLIKKYCLEKRVTFFQGVAEVISFLQIAEIFVMPSRFEGLSNAILEAMACELAVVATNVEGNAELITDGVNGLLVAKDDEVALTNALTLLLTFPEKARDLGGKGKEWVEKTYDLEKIAEKHIQLYKNLLTFKR